MSTKNHTTVTPRNGDDPAEGNDEDRLNAVLHKHDPADGGERSRY